MSGGGRSVKDDASLPGTTGPGAAGPAADARRPATIRDVAKAAEVSIATASKALNGQGKLREETRARVRAAAAALGFRPNDLAQSLHRRRSFTVGLISNDNYGRFSIPILSGLEQALSENRLSVFLCNGADDPATERQHLESLLSKRIDGLILTARRIDRRPSLEAAEAGIPYLYVFAQDPDARALCLLPDDEGGARLAVEHLVQRGRRRIAHVTGPEHFEAVRLRRAGYRSVLAEAGLAVDERLIISGPWSEATGHEAVAALFAGLPAAWPDAVFCGSDQIARGVADALRERGIGVPADVALVGFDNWEVIAAATRPPLTTVDMNLTELGKVAGRMLVGLIDGTVRETGVQRCPCTLVVRASSGAAAGG